MVKDSLKNHRDNCFDLIRHAAALMVIFSHHFAFFGLNEPHISASTKLGSFSVLVFFSVSGFLITNSKVSSSSNLSFCKKRVLRIWPGLICCAFFTTYIICGMFGEKTFLSWCSSLQAVKTFLYYSFLGSHASDEMTNYFSSQFIFSSSVNSSLWTLMFEVLDYLLVLAIFSVIRQQVLASVLFLSCSVLAYVVNDKFGISDYYLGRLSALSITFSIGSLLFSTYDFWKEGWKKYAIPGIGVLSYIFSLFTNTSSEWDIFMLIAVPLLIIPAGLSFRSTLTEGRIDISYGMYVYAFPVQQLIINKTGFGFVESLLISLLSVFCLALFSWLFIEKPFLKRKQVQPIKRG